MSEHREVGGVRKQEKIRSQVELTTREDSDLHTVPLKMAATCITSLFFLEELRIILNVFYLFTSVVLDNIKICLISLLIINSI